MDYAFFNQAILKHVLSHGHSTALQSSSSILTYAKLHEEISQLRQKWVLANKLKPIAIAISNHPSWIVLDIAALGDEIPLVPIPPFFSDAQILHSVIDAGAGTFITDEPDRYTNLLKDMLIKKSTLMVAGKRLMQLDINTNYVALPKSTAKITYTSGTTGNPKGVCLNASSMLAVANSIVNTTGIDNKAQHLSVLPLPTLLENVAGVYAALIAGATVHLLSCEEVGFSGSQFDINRLHQVLLKTKANTAILIPELLSGLVEKIESGAPKLVDMQFLAVGGAAVSDSLLKRARKLDLPVYQGYGLSECASVVTLNNSLSNKCSSVGKPLVHTEIKLGADNEILVKGPNFLGYTGDCQVRLNNEWLETGDIGEVDAEGYLYIKGRKKNIFITSFGRNVSPEWVESTLLNSTNILQVCVYGEAAPWNIALLVTKPNVSIDTLNADIDSVNQLLPDYARITRWVAVKPFTSANQQLTLNGRLKRQEIQEAYQQTIQNLYKELT